MSDHRDDAAATRRAGAGPERVPKLDASILPRSTVEIALNCAGFFVGLLIMIGDYLGAGRSLEPKHWEFLESPRAMVWIFLVAGSSRSGPPSSSRSGAGGRTCGATMASA